MSERGEQMASKGKEEDSLAPEKAWVLVRDSEADDLLVATADPSVDYSAIEFCRPVTPLGGRLQLANVGWRSVELAGRFALQKRLAVNTLRLVFDGHLVASGSNTALYNMFISQVIPLQNKLEELPTETCVERLNVWVNNMDTLGYQALVTSWEVVDEDQTAHADSVASILKDLKEDRLKLPKYPVPLEYVDLNGIHRDLLCFACECPAVDPHRSDIFYREHIFCRQCLLAEGNGGSGYYGGADYSEFARPAQRERDLLGALRVRCPFCGAEERRARIESHMDSCQLVNFACPFATAGCAFKARDAAALLEHWLGCNYVGSTVDFGRGSFAAVNRDVMQIIVAYLNVRDVRSLSLVNKWAREVVIDAYQKKTCAHCGFIHDKAREYHPGTWANVSYHDVLYAKRNARAQRLKENASAFGAEAAKGAAVGAAGVGAALLGVIVGAPLVALGFLAGSGTLAAYGLAIPIMAAQTAGKHVKEKVDASDKFEPHLVQWTCCDRPGSFAAPCCVCEPE